MRDKLMKGPYFTENAQNKAVSMENDGIKIFVFATYLAGPSARHYKPTS